MSGLIEAVTFLTRIPAGAREQAPSELSRAVPWFPVVGAGVGLVIGGTYAAAGLILPPLVAAALAVTTGMLLTGAFHEDGLADVADAFAGGYTRERRLEILKDPRHGTFGVSAIAIALLARVAAIASLDAWAAIAVVPCAHAISRSAAVLLMRWPAATLGGLGAGYGGELSHGRWAAGLAGGGLIAVAGLGVWGLPAAGIAAGAAVAVGGLARAKIGGIVGDVLGAAQQIAEIAVLCLAVAALQEGWDTIPWWRP